MQVFTLSPASSAAAPEHRRHLRCSTHNTYLRCFLFLCGKGLAKFPHGTKPATPILFGQVASRGLKLTYLLAQADALDNSPQSEK